MASKENHYVGIDIGGTKIAGAIVTAGGAVFQRFECPTPVQKGGKAILQQAIELCEALVAEGKKDGNHIKGIGVGAGGQIDAQKGLVYSATEVLPGWKGTKIADGFKSALKINTRVDNDVNVLALGECRFGAAADLKNKKGTIVFLALGTGVGGALVSRGQIHHGAHFSGGEFGHILLSMAADARMDTGGARGTLEAYCSGPAMVETYREFSKRPGEDLTGHDVVKIAVQEKRLGIEDGPAGRAIRATGEYLGFGLTSLANALDPDLIIIGGGLASLGEELLTPARAILQTRALPGPATCPVVTAALGSDAAVIGAASLVID